MYRVRAIAESDLNLAGAWVYCGNLALDTLLDPLRLHPSPAGRVW